MMPYDAFAFLFFYFIWQVIKLYPETESMRGGTRLFFLAGNRVLKYLGKALDNERALTKMLR